MEDLSALGALAKKLAGAKARSQADAALFEDIFLPEYRCWRSFFISVGFHIVLVAVLVPLTKYDPAEEAWKRRAMQYRRLEIRLPDHTYLASAPPKKEPIRKPEKPKDVAKEVAKAEKAPAPPGAESKRLAYRRFELPEVRKVNLEQTLLQAHLPPDLALKEQVKLPQMMFWGAHNLNLPKPAPKKFVEPGRSAPTARSVELEAPPSLDMPSRITSDFKVVSKVAGPKQALLHLPRPSFPVKVFHAPTGSRGGAGESSVDVILGEPVNVLAISPNPALPGERVSIPLGNQIGRLPPPSPGGDDSGAVQITAATPGAGTGGTGKGGQADGASDGKGGDAKGNGREGGGQLLAMAKSAPAINYASPVRVEHPSNAVFDIVVVQSATNEGLPDSAGILSGQPVYSVYLQIGAPRPWILQYCVPQEIDKGPKVVAGIVYIGNPSPVKAPYPLLTVLPPVTSQPRSGYIMLHGFIDKKGKFEDLNLLRAPDPYIEELLLPHLLEWSFRPATRDGVPVAVEILLAIPPQEG